MQSTSVNVSYTPNYVLHYSYMIDTKHEKNVSIILYMEKKDVMITGSYDHCMRVWNMKANDPQKRLIGFLKGHTHSIYSIIKIDDNTIASGGNDNTIKVWDINQLQCLTTIDTQQNILCMLLLNQRMLITSTVTTFYIWNLPSYSLFKSVIQKDSCIYCLELYTDNLLALGGFPPDLFIYDLSSNQIAITLKGHSSTILQVKKIGKNKLITSSDDQSLRIWDINSKVCLITLTGHQHTIWSILVLNEKYVLSSSWDSTIKLWNIETKQCITTATIQENRISIYCIEQISPTEIAIGTKNSIVFIWNI